MKKKKKENEHLSWKETFLLNQRAIKIWWNLYPQVFLSDAVYQITSIFISYLTIWFSARIIEELTNKKDPNRLFSLIFTLLASNLILSILNAICKHWHEITNNMAYEKLDHYYNEKMLSMDFVSMDHTHTHDLFSQIKQNANWADWGLTKLLPLFGNITKSIFGIFAAIALSWQLFILPIPEHANRLIWMNHPIFHLLILFLLFGAVMLSPAISNRAGEYWSRYAESATFGNRAWRFFGCMGY